MTKTLVTIIIPIMCCEKVTEALEDPERTWRWDGVEQQKSRSAVRSQRS